MPHVSNTVERNSSCAPANGSVQARFQWAERPQPNRVPLRVMSATFVGRS
jgi:hypothetical protein